MFSLGTDDPLAFAIASVSPGLPDTSAPPVRAATSMFLISLANSLPRRESMTAFLFLVVAHFECPLMAAPSGTPARIRRRAGAHADHPSVQGGRRSPTERLAEPRRSYPR